MPPPTNILNQSPKGIPQSNRILIGVGVAVIIVVIIYFTWISQANHKEEAVEHKPQPTVDISTKDNTPEWLDKYKQVKLNPAQAIKPQTPQEIEKQTITNQQITLNQGVIEDQFQTQLEIQKIEDKNKIDEKKLEIEAMKSSLSVTIPNPPAPQTNQAGKAGLGDALELLDHIPDTAKVAKNPDLGSYLADINNQDEKKNFLKMGDQDSDYLKSRKVKPLSPYEVKAGTYIPAALITGINSDLPGSIVAQVTENVYDTVTGNYILIPQGAKLVGSYDSKITFGENRALVVWNRLIFPDGSSIDLEKMQGVDIAGYAGLKDKLDNHYLKIYGNALLLSLVGSGYDILNRKAQQTTDTRDTVAAQIGQKLADVSSKTLEKNMDVQPTIIIDPGIRFNVIVMKDMVLEEIKDAEGTLTYAN